MSALFEMEPRPPLSKGDEVDVQFIWGNERCEITGLGQIDGHPVVQVRLPGGSQTAVVDAARVHSVR